MQFETNASRKRVGRPKGDQLRRIRMMTTIEPAKLVLLREHAKRTEKSLGELADDYVKERFPAADTEQRNCIEQKGD
jgi:hypothetical protein